MDMFPIGEVTILKGARQSETNAAAPITNPNFQMPSLIDATDPDEKTAGWRKPGAIAFEENNRQVAEDHRRDTGAMQAESTRDLTYRGCGYFESIPTSATTVWTSSARRCDRAGLETASSEVGKPQSRIRQRRHRNKMAQRVRIAFRRLAPHATIQIDSYRTLVRNLRDHDCIHDPVLLIKKPPSKFVNVRIRQQ